MLDQFLLAHVVDFLSAIVMPLMLIAFFGGLVARALIYYTAKSEARFSVEFEKRVRVYLMATNAPRVASFYRITRILLEKTFIECFETRDKFKRRNLDAIWSLADRLFLIQDGARRLVEDTLRGIRYFRREGMPPKMVETSKAAFEANPYFNKVLGIFPVAFLHEMLNILPGMFLIGGILGTFLGISKGLPELGAMDMGNVVETKRVMDTFLLTISHAMLKSIIGIAFSAAMTLINTIFSVEGTYYALVNRYSNALDYLWNETTTNEVDAVDHAPQASAPPTAPRKAA